MTTAAETTGTTEAMDANPLLNHLIGHLRLKNDAALARELETPPPVLSKLRHGRMTLGATLLVRMHEVSQIPIKELRELMGDRRKYFRGAATADVEGA